MSSQNFDVTVKTPEKVGKTLFEWFSNNILKANAEKCYLVLSIYETLSVNIDNEVIKDSKSVWIIS